jgi:3-isopropylmalate dehydrogenase
MSKEVNIGVIYGEGVGKELIEKIFMFKSFLEKKFNIKIHVILYNKSENVEELITFLNSMKKEMIPVLSGPLTEGRVYKIRKSLDLYCKLVEIFTFDDFNPHNIQRSNILLIRENTGGIYAGDYGNVDNGIAFHRFTYSKPEIEKIFRKAINFAKNRGNKITTLLKDDGIPSISSLWRETAHEMLCRENNDVDIEFMNVDSVTGLIVSSPKSFDVLLTPNFIGDIITDILVSLFQGSRGMGASINIGDKPFAVYQTIHGSATDIAGKNVANPVGQLLSLGLLFKYSYSMLDVYNAIKYGINLTLRDGYRTFDICDFDNNNLVNTDQFLKAVFGKIGTFK